MQQGTLASGVALGLITSVMCSGVAFAQGDQARDEKPVVEQILDILRDRKQITEKEHQELLNKAQQEEAEKAATAAQAQNTAQEVEPLTDEDNFRVYWKDSVRFETKDGDFKFRIGGRMQLDAGITGPSGVIQQEFDVDGVESGVRFRRARLYLSGTFFKDFDFKFQYDFAGGVSGFKDVYIGANSVPFLQRVQVGHFKEPFSLEQIASSNDITFMERSLQSPFEASRNTGVGVFMHFLDKRMMFATGGFRIVDDLGDGFGSDSPYSIAARLTGTPIYEEEGRTLLHLGLSYDHNFLNGEEVRFRQRPSTGFGPRLVNTGDFVTGDINFIDPEVALVLGPFSVQAEYLQSFVDQEELNDPRFFGWYAEVSYFLTGEHRPYSAEKATFTRLKPNENFGWGEGTGWGAFQVGARVSQLNLNSGGIDGGRLQDLTLGLNWYLNPVMRIMFNYVYGDRSSPSGSENVYQMRFQLAF